MTNNIICHPNQDTFESEKWVVNNHCGSYVGTRTFCTNHRQTCSSLVKGQNPGVDRWTDCLLHVPGLATGGRSSRRFARSSRQPPTGSVLLSGLGKGPEPEQLAGTTQTSRPSQGMRLSTHARCGDNAPGGHMGASKGRMDRGPRGAGGPRGPCVERHPGLGLAHTSLLG